MTTALDEKSQGSVSAPAKKKGDITTQQEFRIETQTGVDTSVGEGFSPERMLDTNTDTHTGTGNATHNDTQTDTRHKTASGELSSLESHHDPDHTMGCNTCQADLVDAIADQCRINVGDVIASRYEIKQYLGEGGMSAVYAAVDRVIKRDVALKILHRDLLVRGKGSLLRFQREAQALGNLDHPNIVKIHHFDADENAQPYIVMDIVKGEALAKRLVRDPESIKFSDIIDIFVQVCDALAHAHERGVVHRDLKPSNIMVVGNQVKVLDFGIAKLMSEDSDQELQLTRTGEVFGSPLYMSPEQCRGLKLDFRSDIYSIGCVMYEAFTGSPPFTGNSHIDTMLKHVNDLPASVVSSMCDARYAEKVDAILLRCMAKNPNARFQSMDEVKAALLELERDTKGPLEQLKRKLELIRLKIGAQGKFTKKMIAAYCAAGMVVTGLAATALVQQQNSVLHFDFKDASVAHWKELDERGQSLFDSGKYSEAEATFRGELEMAKKLANRQLRLASCHQLLDLLHAKAILDPSVTRSKSYQEELSKLNQELAQIRKEESTEIAGLKGDIAAAGTMSPKERTKLCDGGLDTALALSDAGRHADSIAIASSILPIAQNLKNDVLVAKTHQVLGRAYESDKNIESAKAEFAKALSIRDKVLPQDDPEIARSLAHLARHLPPADAEEKLERAKNIFSRALNPASHQVGWVEQIMAQSYNKAGEFRLARQAAEAAVSKCKGAIENQNSEEEKIRAKQSLVRALIQRGLANTELLNQDLKKGGKVADKDAREAAIAKDFHDALSYVEDLNPKPNVTDMDIVMSFLLAEDAKALKKQYEFEMSKSGSVPVDANGKAILLKDAQVRLARAIAINERLPNSSEMTRKAADYYLWMGKVSRALLDFPYSIKCYEKAKEMSDRTFGANSPVSLDIQNELKAVLRDSGLGKK
ncbi:MAG: serine/threonine-protein kinase [Candidatus Obscuribacterales bacterium]|nr:serine/threonine-protein kinase [Candidatus Obscuribacterales bacterium]